MHSVCYTLLMVKTTKKVTPKARAATKKSPAKKSWYKQMWPKYWVMVSLALFLLLVLGYIGLNKYQIAQEKKQFDAAEVGLDGLYADIVKELGRPITVDKDVSCNYSSAKDSKGFLRCGTRYSLKYPAKSASEADMLSNKIMNVVETSDEISVTYKRDFSFATDKKGYSNYPVIEYIFKGLPEPSCSLANYYEDAQTLTSSFGCSELAKTEHYPLKN